MNEVDWAYLAGLIDGEGALDLGIHLRTSSYKGKRYRAMGCSPKIYIGLKAHPINQHVFDWITMNLGSNVIVNGRMWMVEFWGEKLGEILTKVLPYLKIKKREAEILLEAYKINKGKKGYWTLEVAQKFAKLQDQLFSIRLKNRGHLRKWTGDKIVATFKEIIKERKKDGRRVGACEKVMCINCGTPLTKSQILSRQKFCSHKCYINFYYKRPKRQ